MISAVRAASVVSAVALACCGDPRAPGPRPGALASAEDVTLEIGSGDRRVVARGRRLTVAREGKVLELEGDALVESGGAHPWSARARRITVLEPGPRIVLEGDVRATFALDRQEIDPDAP
jgi:hypothetical protein